jgi:hypothetical protein
MHCRPIKGLPFGCIDRTPASGPAFRWQFCENSSSVPDSRASVSLCSRLAGVVLHPVELRREIMEFMRIVFVAALAVGLVAAAEIKLGRPLNLKNPTPIATLLAKPSDYVGKSVQVKGKIAGVCQMMGCWIDLVDEQGQKLRIKVNDGDIEFPKDATGKMAVAEGRFDKIELTEKEAAAQAEEEAKERGKKLDRSKIKGPVTIYQVQGAGAVIFPDN